MIEIRLGNVKYNFSKMDDTGMAPICRVQSWNLEQMQQERVIKALDVKLGPFQPGAETEVVLYAHLRAKLRDSEESEWYYANADLVICVTEEDRERVSGVTLGEETAYQSMKGKISDYYVSPRHWKVVQGRYQDVESSHYTVAGTEKVYVHYTDGTKDVISVTSKPSIEAQDYQEMINDLYAISSELLMDTNAHTKVSIGNAQHNQLQNMQKLVSKIEDAWARLRVNLENDLAPEYVKMPVDRIKNMTVKSLLEYRFTGNPNVHAVQYKETKDIYENRMILQFFRRMEAYLRRQKASALQSITHVESGYMDDFQETESASDRITMERIENKLRTWHFDTVKNEILTNTADCAERYQTQPQDTEVVEKDNFVFSLAWWNHQQMPAWSAWQKRPENADVVNRIDWQYVYLSDISLNQYDDTTKREVYGAISRNQDQFDDTEVCVRMNNYKLIRFLYYVVSEAHRDAVSRSLGKGDWVRFDINGSVELVDAESYRYANKHTLWVYISRIDTVTVREKGITETMTFTYSEQEDYLEYGPAIVKMLLMESAKNEMDRYADTLACGQMVLAIEEKKKRRWQQEHAETLAKQQRQEWDALIRRMEKLSRAKDLSHVPKTREILRCTNIFASNQKYHAMYQLMKRANEFNHEIYYDEMDDIPILKLEQLYERWCLTKLLHIFVSDYGFELLDNKGNGYGAASRKKLYKYINQLLINGNFKDSEFHLKGQLFDTDNLKRHQNSEFPVKIEEGAPLKQEDGKTKYMDGVMLVDIYYNHEFILGDNVAWTEDMIPEGGRPKQKLIPDFYVKMTYRGETKHFCLDAKYRTRNNLTWENGTRRWYVDLMSVALQKYIVELSEVQPIDGSFILHSNAYCCVGRWDYQDCNPHAYCGQNLEKLWRDYSAYLQTDPDKNMLISERASRFFTENEQNVFYLGKELLRYRNDNRIGSYYLLPGKDIYLRVWITMIMEHYFGIYDAMCWNCGHKVKIEDVSGTSADRYVVSCPECGTAWVRNFCSNESCRRPIGKHLINYYAMAQGNNKWNRVCPTCHAGWSYLKQ